MIAVALALVVATAPPWCARAEDAAAALDLDALAAAMPTSAAPHVAQARALADDDEAAARELVALVVRDSCAPTSSVDARAAAADVQAIVSSDPRFGGVRRGDDALDRWLHALWLRIVALLESEGMQTYTGSARIVYLALLGLVAVVLAVWVVRNRVRTQGTHRAHDAERATAARRRAFASYREEAALALAATDARAALRAGQAALRARVGELDAGAVAPARTGREVVRALAPSVAAVVAPSLAIFDAAFFGRDATLDDARRFLAEVDAAEARLGRGV